MAVIARHLLILGRVQGVFYRNWTTDTADRIGITGWVRNRMDGSVEAWIEGPADSVTQFIALAHEGPSAAKVARIEIEDVAAKGFTIFEKRPTC
ncbi:acylphosphatase [Sphingobium mellinum]|uniref:acylphosphatase n=1 Tax=Sphingobium mellinum TaxID=1387166 RepID=UPI0030EF5C76